MGRYLKGRNAKLQCSTKKKYFTEVEAQKAATALRRKTGAPWRAYRCSGLRGERRHWHLTSGRKW